MHHYDELKWYFFGLHAGLRNLWASHFALGWKKTLGKILQPINTYTRFPEFQIFLATIAPEVTRQAAGDIKLLDVGGPKLFGLFLASEFAVEAHLTDLNEKELSEYSILWSALRESAAGKAVFERQDARDLHYQNDSFEVAYAMSVLEHVEGEGGDSRAISEMWRVLAPGGLLVISVPYGEEFTEQEIRGFSYTAGHVDRRRSYFFQRIYDREAAESRLVRALDPAPLTTCRRSIFRSPTLGATSIYHRVRRLIGLNVSGLIGVVNPLLSVALNRDCEGYAEGFPNSYGKLHSLSDVYGDIVLVCRKPPQLV